MHTYIHTYIHTCIHTCIHTYMHTSIHTSIHAYIHTYIYAYTYDLSIHNIWYMGKYTHHHFTCFQHLLVVVIVIHGFHFNIKILQERLSQQVQTRVSFCRASIVEEKIKTASVLLRTSRLIVYSVSTISSSRVFSHTYFIHLPVRENQQL